MRHGLECHDGKTICQAQQPGHCAAEGVPDEPDLGVGIQGGHVGEETLGGGVVPRLFVEGRDETGAVAGVGACCAVADLAPGPDALLGTTAGAEEVVVFLVVGGCAGTVPYGYKL
jgi:hypothetical protein